MTKRAAGLERAATSEPSPRTNAREDTRGVASVPSSIAIDAGGAERLEATPANTIDCSRDETGRLSCGECGIDSDCPVGKGCVLDATSRRTVCLGSNCQQDSDCPTGACVLLTGGTASNAVVRRCASRGDRELNASCLGVGTSNRCAPGLECSIAAGGVCRPSCETNDCPTGQQCVREEMVSVCLNSCSEDSACGEGLTCELVTGTLKQCLRRVGTNCLREDAGCGAGEQCVRSLRAGTIRFQCVLSCDPFSPQCPNGGVCGSWGTRSVCFAPCKPENLGRDCLPNHTCATVDEEGRTWGCTPQE